MSRDILKRNIAEERLRLGMTQEDLARRLNVSTSTISLYETGARVPNIDGIESLCSIFRTSIDKLTGFREDGDDPAEQFETAVGKIFQSMGFSVARKKETRNIPADEYFRDFPEEIRAQLAQKNARVPSEIESVEIISDNRETIYSIAVNHYEKFMGEIWRSFDGFLKSLDEQQNPGGE